MAETTPKSTRVWLNSLPFSDNSQTTRDLYRSIYTLNRLEIDPAKRTDILELYRTPVNTVTATFQQTLGQQPLPVAENVRRMIEIVRELNREMSLGYKIVLLDQQGNWKHRLMNKSPALVVERAMRYLGEVLVHCYHTYLPFPSQIWSELNELYRFSEFTDLLETTVKIDLGRDAGATSIEERYKQICLLGVCNPYQLPQGDARKIHIFLYRWANMAVLRQLDTTSVMTACFQIDLLRDAPPVYYSSPIDPMYEKRARILDANALVSQIQSFVQRLENGEPASQLDLGTECLDIACLELLRRMNRAWATASARQHGRSGGKGILSVCVGLNAIHFFADGQRPFSAPVDVKSATTPTADETDDVEPLDIDVDLIDETEQREPAPPLVAEDFHVTHWEIVDQSANGLFLRSMMQSGIKVRIGEILGVQFDGKAGAEWWPATVRRLQGDAAGMIEIGIELLASQLEPAAVCAADGTGIYHAALTLPALETTGKKSPRSLVIPRGVFREQADMLLVVGGELPPVRVRPLMLVEHSNSFEQIYFAEVLTKTANV
ncbi:MAG: hypothetical protein V3S12_00930 [Acidiferrobacterales bacterium]